MSRLCDYPLHVDLILDGGIIRRQKSPRGGRGNICRNLLVVVQAHPEVGSCSPLFTRPSSRALRPWGFGADSLHGSSSDNASGREQHSKERSSPAELTGAPLEPAPREDSALVDAAVAARSALEGAFIACLDDGGASLGLAPQEDSALSACAWTMSIQACQPAPYRLPIS